MTSPRKRSMLSRRARPAARDTSLAPAARGTSTRRRSALVMQAFLGCRPGAHALVPTMLCTDARKGRFEMMCRVDGGAALIAAARGRARKDDHPALRPCFMLSHQGQTPGMRL